jgi:predicted nuclease of predicted toxin-antitoxin system
MARAEDTEIVRFAHDHNVVIVTLDADFHALLATSGASKPSVIRLRLQGLDGMEVAGRVAKVAQQFHAELARGSVTTVKASKTTCHLLPTGSG